MATDQNRAKLRGKVHPEPTPQIVPMFPEHDWEATSLVSTSKIRTEQQAIKEGVNDPTLRGLLARTPQGAKPSADAPEFQPFRSDSEKEEVRWQHGSESAGQYAGIDSQPGTPPGGLAEDSMFNAKTRLVGDMVTGPDPKGVFRSKNAPVDLGADMATGGEPDGPGNQTGTQDYHRAIKDFPGTGPKFVQNAPNPES